MAVSRLGLPGSIIGCSLLTVKLGKLLVYHVAFSQHHQFHFIFYFLFFCQTSLVTIHFNLLRVSRI